MAHALVFEAFGRAISSDVELRLLRPKEGQRSPAASIVFSDEPRQPTGGQIGGADDLVMTMFRDGDGVLFSLNTTGWLARFTPGSAAVTLHPDARLLDPLLADSSRMSRVLGDRLVSSVVPFIPQLWGRIAIHGALLRSPKGPVLLLGPSGVGKSTLSQVLRRDHGWRVLDDDTSMVGPVGNEAALIPMGARARLRHDASSHLGLQADTLPGHSGLKGALPHDADGDLNESLTPLVTVVSLEPSLSSGERETSEPTCHRVSSTLALATIHNSLFSLRIGRLESRKEMFVTAAALASVPQLTIEYVHHSDSPEDVAAALVRELLD